MPGVASGTQLRKADFTDEWVAHFWARTVKVGDCLHWTGAHITSGRYSYGVVTLDQKNLMVRRVALALSRGECPGGMPVRNSCSDSSCVNPKHLYTTSVKDMVQTSDKQWRGLLSPKEVERIRNLWPKKKTREIVAMFPHVPEDVVRRAGNNVTHFDPTYVPVSHASCTLAGHAKLTAARVARARKRRMKGWTLTSLAASEGVAISTMSDALLGRTWKCVQDPAPVALVRSDLVGD